MSSPWGGLMGSWLMLAWLTRVYVVMRLDLTEYFRYRLAVISSILTPVVMVLAFGIGLRQSQFLAKGNPYIVFVTPGILALGVMLSSVYSAGYTVVLDRQRRLMDDIILSPVSYSAFITGRVGANLVKSSLQFTLTLLGVIFWLGVIPRNVPLLMLIFILSAVFFSALGMTLAVHSNMLSFGGLANVVTVPLMYFCGVFFPVDYFEGAMRIFHYVPFTSSIELMRFAFNGTTLVGTPATHFLILGWSTVGLLLLGGWLFKKSIRDR
jgi:ABC-2 type transport system permease protein